MSNETIQIVTPAGEATIYRYRNDGKIIGRKTWFVPSDGSDAGWRDHHGCCAPPKLS